MKFIFKFAAVSILELNTSVGLSDIALLMIITPYGFPLCFHYAFFTNLSNPPIDSGFTPPQFLERNKQEKKHTHTHKYLNKQIINNKIK